VIYPWGLVSTRRVAGIGAAKEVEMDEARIVQRGLPVGEGMMEVICAHCGARVETPDPEATRADCPICHAALHVQRIPTTPITAPAATRPVPHASEVLDDALEGSTDYFPKRA
jgi:DNA-directed RNA polymerase subunit RPC12/RpoP